MKQFAILLLFLGGTGIMQAQDYFPKNDGVKEENHNFTAFTNATLYISPNKVVKKGTLIVQDGKVFASGKGISIPNNAIVVDLDEKYIYPSFIESYSGFGIEKPKRESGGRSPQYDPTREGFYWNDHIRPETKGIESFVYDKKDAEALRKIGFGVVNTHKMDGIARGTGVLVALNDEEGDSKRILEDVSGQFFSFEKSNASRQSYPTSLMGAMALLRQLYHDLDWYSKGLSNTTDRSLEAMIENKNIPAFFEAGDKGNDMRADQIGDQFGMNYIIIGGGDEYESIDGIKKTDAKYIIPLNFPDAYDVSNPYYTKYLSIEDLRAWNQAPQNPKVLANQNITFALSTFKLEKVSDFSKNLQKAIEYGFDETKALESLTTTPASLLGKSAIVGTLEPGKWANFLISSGNIFNKETILYENWVQGDKHVINDMGLRDLTGKYDVKAGGQTFQMTITGEVTKPKIKVKQEGKEFSGKISYEDQWMIFSMTNDSTNEVYRGTASVSEIGNNLSGRWVLPNGTETTFSATRTGNAEKEEAKKDKENKNPELLPLTYPNVGYGYRSKPKAQNILFQNATVWTGEDAGILEQTDVLIRNGKIEQIGKNLSAGGATTIDATGKHLTAGIVDEHSHLAALSINESGQNSSAEVSITDVINPEDINIYRNLAGGVTSIQILHGSANPIGGRSAIIKLKWGEDAEGLQYKDMPKFIKFALGENVKQSNWQSFNRFPQTRMGVEQLYVNYFNRAKAYDEEKKTNPNFRYDEELEVLSEILKGERFISCHSYVQSEINMLMKVADRFGFKVNTFTHILEGYKVADKMAEHGVGGSTFSDWWAYKFEVKDAIPYNAAIMAKAGVTTAINSDDDEMSRRLNQEAAKAIKYGGMSEEEAWKMVTLNPAKLLHIDHRVGSIKEGKDADVVLWSDHPLSVFAKAEKTMIEGAVYFDLEKDKAQRELIKEERSKLTQMMLTEKANGGKTKEPMKEEKIKFECETIN